MHRFYLPPERAAQSELLLDERESHHAANVLRVRQGERVVVLDGRGIECMCEVLSLAKNAVRLRVQQRNRIAPLPYRITLLQAMTKGKSMDAIIQKAAELCAARVVPLAAERSVAQVEEESREAKLEKWRAIAIDAIKQCGSAWLPQIEAPVTPREFLARNERFELPLIAALHSSSRHPRERFQTFVEEQSRLPKSLCVWVGPEGDFTPAEANDILSAGVLPITLGQVILRSETAAVYCLSVLNYELQAPRR